MRQLRWALMLIFGTTFTGCSCEQEVFVVQSGPKIALSPALLDFGEVPQGLSATRSVEVFNLGQQNLDLNELQLSEADSAFSVAFEPVSVPPSSSKSLSITFAPPTIDFFRSTILVESNAENTPVAALEVSGRGITDSICGDCDDPPGDRCMSENDLLVYDPTGACVEGQCQYQASQIYCAAGCDASNNRCHDDSNLPPSVDAGNGNAGETADAGVWVPEGDYVEEVQAGNLWTCLRWSSHVVECFGINKWGQLGRGWWDGQNEDSINGTLEPTLIPQGHALSALETGNTSTTATTTAGKIFCWGSCSHRRPSNNQGQNIHTPEEVPGLAVPDRVKVGWGHSCGTRGEGDLVCWGSNWFGGLGTGDDFFPANGGPITVAGVSDVVEFAVGYHHTCALQADGRLFCWGWNHRYQVSHPVDDDEVCPSHPDNLCVLSPREIDGLDSAFKRVAAGTNNTCAITEAEGLVYCWGDNQSGALGNGFSEPFARVGEPVATEDLGQPAVDLAMGSTFVLALMEDGSIMGWGRNQFGQLGNGAIATAQVSPEPVGYLPSPAIQVSAGTSHACALLADRSVWCWGNNSHGQLGDGSATDSSIPVQVVLPESENE